MMNNQLKTFTDRREAIALFNLLRGRDPNQPWPLLPIIAFIAPSGCGKSMLINELTIIAALLVGLQRITQIPVIQTLLQRLEKGACRRWFLSHGSYSGLQTNADIRNVLIRLYMMSSNCEPGKQGHEYLEEY